MVAPAAIEVCDPMSVFEFTLHVLCGFVGVRMIRCGDRRKIDARLYDSLRQVERKTALRTDQRDVRIGIWENFRRWKVST